MDDQNLTQIKLEMVSGEEERCLDDQNTTSRQPSLEQGANASEIHPQIKLEEIEFINVEDLDNSSDKDEPSNSEIQPVIESETETARKWFACKICDYKCKQKDSLTVHLKTHTGEKPFVCKICGYKSRQYSHLITHLRSHLFVCEICDSEFTRKANLKAHSVTHMGQKWHVCKLCEFSSARKEELQKHVVNFHTAVTVFACKLCDYKCIANEYLIKHITATHPGKPN